MQNWSLLSKDGSQIVIDFVVKHVETIYLETYELDQKLGPSVVEGVLFIARDHHY